VRHAPFVRLGPAVVAAAWLMHGFPAGAETVPVDECVRLALARSPGARAAGFAVQAASGRVRAAVAAYAPRLLGHSEYGVSGGFSDVVTNGGSTAAVVTVETTLLDGGLRDAHFAAARARLRSAAAIEQQRRADVALAVRTAYFTSLAARAQAGIQESTLHALGNYVVLLQQQEDLGVATHDDVLRAQLAVEAARSAQRSAEAQLETARNELGTLTGLDVPATSLTEPAPEPIVDATAAVIDASPVMVDVLAAAEAARRDADAVRSEWFGAVTLTASGGALGVRPGPTFHDNWGGEFLLGFTVPFFDGGGMTARLAAAVADANGAAAAAEQSRQEVSIALSGATVEARRAQDDVHLWEQAIPRAAEHFQLMRARHFGGGSVRLLEVLDAVAQDVDTRLNVARALLAYRLAVATQHQILGEATP
jgi:outer membrane protein TolC